MWEFERCFNKIINTSSNDLIINDLIINDSTVNNFDSESPISSLLQNFNDNLLSFIEPDKFDPSLEINYNSQNQKRLELKKERKLKRELNVDNTNSNILKLEDTVKLNLLYITSIKPSIDKFLKAYSATEIRNVLIAMGKINSISETGWYNGDYLCTYEFRRSLGANIDILDSFMLEVDFAHLTVRGQNKMNGTGYGSEFKINKIPTSTYPKSIKSSLLDYIKGIISRSEFISIKKIKIQDIQEIKDQDPSCPIITRVSIDSYKDVQRNLRKLINSNTCSYIEVEGIIKAALGDIKALHLQYISEEQFWEFINACTEYSRNKDKEDKEKLYKNKLLKVQYSLKKYYPKDKQKELSKLYFDTIPPLRHKLRSLNSCSSDAMTAMQEIDGGNLVIQHNVKSNSGRDYHSVSNINKIVRGIVFKDWLSLDVSNMAPTSLLFFADSYGIDLPYLRDFVENRQYYIDMVNSYNAKKGTNLNFKTLGLLTIFGARGYEYRELRKKIEVVDKSIAPLISNIKNDLDILKSFIKDNFNEIVLEWNFKIEFDKSNILSLVFMNIESTIMNKIKTVLDRNDIVRIHDELLIKDSICSRDQIKQIKEIQEEWNIKIPNFKKVKLEYKTTKDIIKDINNNIIKDTKLTYKEDNTKNIDKKTTVNIENKENLNNILGKYELKPKAHQHKDNKHRYTYRLQFFYTSLLTSNNVDNIELLYQYFYLYCIWYRNISHQKRST